MGDVDVKLVKGVAAEILEVFLHLHLDIVSSEVAAKLIAVSPELVGNGRKKDTNPHGAPVARRAARAFTLLARRRATCKSLYVGLVN